MGPPDPIASAARLNVSVEALAALAAHVRTENEGLDVDPQVRELLRAVAAELLGPDADVSGAGAVAVLARTFLAQATELVAAPDRRGGWAYADADLLQAQGRLSMGIAGGIAEAAEVLDGLQEALAAPGARVLDVGTGTGWLAIALARTWPAARVVGIDVYEPALALAEANVAGDDAGARVELRRQDVAELDDEAAYDAIWAPLPFLPRAIVPAAFAALARSLRPGGWLLPGTYGAPDERLPGLLRDLRTVRSGGHPWRPDEVLALLADAGLVDACEVQRRVGGVVRLFGGRRPPG